MLKNNLLYKGILLGFIFCTKLYSSEVDRSLSNRLDMDSRLAESQLIREQFLHNQMIEEYYKRKKTENLNNKESSSRYLNKTAKKLNKKEKKKADKITDSLNKN